MQTEVFSSGRGSVLLVSVNDRRLAPIYTEDSGGICGEMDGPTFLAIGRKVDDERLSSFAVREGFDASELIEFRNKLSDTVA